MVVSNLKFVKEFLKRAAVLLFLLQSVSSGMKSHGKRWLTVVSIEPTWRRIAIRSVSRGIVSLHCGAGRNICSMRLSGHFSGDA